MTKINQEEYEMLKGLDDQWKWIARDSAGDHGGNLFVYSDKPFKRYDVREWEWDFGIRICSIDNRFFQFIRWEDEDPYNIQELIEEYESKETEVKSKKDLIEKWESAIESAEFYGKGKEEELISYMKDFVSDLNQLDEPEVLSQEWIDKHVETIFDLDEDFENEFIKVDDLQNLLVPKQEELESKIQELIEDYKQEDGAYSNPENAWIGGFIVDLENLVEREQKYYVLNSEGETMIRKSDSRVRTSSGFKIKNGFEGENYKFTEQEIKDYDPRFWPFAVKVEELEE